MKKIISQTTVLLLILASAFACGEEKKNEGELTSLTGTKWKLAGIVGMHTGKLTELEPKNCEECYTLIFDTDTTAWLQSVSNEGVANINRNPPLLGTSTKRGEGGDGYIFVEALPYITSYVQESNKLKFFYRKDEKDSYLLYKPVEK